MEKIKSYFKSCSNTQLRLSLSLTALFLIISAAFIHPPTASFLIFLGTYIVVTAPDWREMLSQGFTLGMPDIRQMKAAVQASAPKPRTNTQRQLDQRRKNKGK